MTTRTTVTRVILRFAYWDDISVSDRVRDQGVEVVPCVAR
jgi:hypothetical protein